ncbi:hypothetical protein BANRA_00010 [Klebsiella pneumoniae]|nr:hypothetical protein BANRA_00010 [Klebsiella pneumoniae]
MSHNKPSRLRFAINLGNAVRPSRGDRKARGHHRRAQPSAGDALGRQRRIRSLPCRKWWLTPVASTGIPFWPSIRRGKPPCALPRPISPSRAPRWSALIRPARAWPTWIARQPPLTSDKTPHTIMANPPSAARQPASPSSSREAIDAFLAGEGDMVAGIRQPLEATARQHAGVRVLADNFTEIQQAICVARADVDRFHAVNDALSEWRADGSLQALIAGHLGQAN